MKSRFICGISIMFIAILFSSPCFAQDALEIYLDDILSCKGTWEYISFDEEELIAIDANSFSIGNDQGEVFVFTLTGLLSSDSNVYILFVYSDDAGVPLLELEYCLLIDPSNNIQISGMELRRYTGQMDDAY